MRRSLTLPALALALAVALPIPAQADAALLAQAHTRLAINDAALRWGVNPAYLQCIGEAESNDIPWAVGAQGEIGAMQIKPATFYAWSPNALDTAKGLWNAWSNADVAAYMISRGQSHEWGPRTLSLCGLYPTAYGE